MNGSPICLDSDFGSDFSFLVGMGVSDDSQSPLLTHDYMGHKVISLKYDFDSVKVYRNSFNEKAYSLESFEALLSNDGGEEDHIEVHILPPIFSDSEL